MKLAVLLPGANRIRLGHSEIWNGPIRASSGETQLAFVKLVDDRTLLIELICSLIAKEIYLPVPQSYLVRIPTQTISTVTQQTYAFGSQVINYPPIASIIREDELIKKRILQWPYLSLCAAFDSWIGNGDRVPNNLLFDGGKDFYMIDHGDALPVYLLAHESTGNKLIQYLLNDDHSEINKQRQLNSLLIEAKKFNNIDLGKVYHRIVDSNRVVSPILVQKLLNRLELRLSSLTSIFKSQLNIRQRDFIYDKQKGHIKKSDLT